MDLIHIGMDLGTWYYITYLPGGRTIFLRKIKTNHYDEYITNKSPFDIKIFSKQLLKLKRGWGDKLIWSSKLQNIIIKELAKKEAF